MNLYPEDSPSTALLLYLPLLSIFSHRSFVFLSSQPDWEVLMGKDHGLIHSQYLSHATP